MQTAELIHELVARFAAIGDELLLAGGTAVNAWGGTRGTFDLDMIPRLDPERWRTAVGIVRDLDFHARIPESWDTIANVDNIRAWMRDKGMLALTFRRHEPPAYEVDFLVAYAGRYEEFRGRAAKTSIAGHPLYVLAIDDLIELKRIADRPIDRFDIEELERIKAGLPRDKRT